jgi:hypothetical protein
MNIHIHVFPGYVSIEDVNAWEFTKKIYLYVFMHVYAYICIYIYIYIYI